MVTSASLLTKELLAPFSSSTVIRATDADEFIHGGFVGDAQQGFGHTHQGDAFLAALKRATEFEKQGYNFSYDMLGEAARKANVVVFGELCQIQQFGGELFYDFIVFAVFIAGV